MTTYTSIEEYLLSCTDLKEELVAVNNIMKLLRIQMAKAAVTSNISEYRIDDGSMKIETIYRDYTALSSTYNQMMNIRNRIKADINNQNVGHSFRMIDGKNLR